MGDGFPLGKERASPTSGGGRRGIAPVNVQTAHFEALPEPTTRGSGTKLKDKSPASDGRENSQKRVERKTTKLLVGDGLLKELERRRSSPSVVAKLMGLDVLPHPELVRTQHRGIGGYFHRTPSSQLLNEVHSFEMSTRGHQDFKDVYEVRGSSDDVWEKRSQQFAKGLPSLRRSEPRSTFKQKKHVDAKLSSSNEIFMEPKEKPRYVLDDFSSVTERFSKIHEESNPLFKKHLRDLKYSVPYPHDSHATILRSAKTCQHESNKPCCASEKTVQKHTHMQKDSHIAHHFPPEHFRYYPYNSLKAPDSDKRGSCNHHNDIVILEPSLDKARKFGNIISLPQSSPSVRSYKYPDLYTDGTDQQNLFEDRESKVDKAKCSGESARILAKALRHSAQRGSYKLPEQSGGNVKYENSFRSDSFWDSNDCYKSSSASSAKLFLSKGVKECLSEHWRTSGRSEEGSADRGSRTLAEMLALSDSEKSFRISDSNYKPTRDTLGREEMPTRWDSAEVACNDGQKDGCFIYLPRYIPHSVNDSCTNALVDGSGNRYMSEDVMNLRTGTLLPRKYSQRRILSKKSISCAGSNNGPYCFGGKANLNEWEIKGRTNLINRVHTVQAESTTEENLNLFNSSGFHSTTDAWNQADNFLTSDCTNEERILPPEEGHSEKLPGRAVFPKEGELSPTNHKAISSTKHQEDHSLANYDQTGSLSLKDPKAAEQPSPVSVLEHPSEETELRSGYYKQFRTKLQDLNIELDLLQSVMDSEIFISSDDDNGRENETIEPVGIVLEGSWNEEERDFSYLLDILIDSGVHCISQSGVYKACQFPDGLVDPSVFLKLEKKYNKLETWPRPERKLLFDLINSTLSEVLSPCMDPHPWVKSDRRIGPMWGPEGLVEKAWQKLVRSRGELGAGNSGEKVLDPKWLSMGSDINFIGKQMERMLTDDLIEEILLEIWEMW